MKVILFDLGNTLEDTQQGVLLEGALETLQTIQGLKAGDGSSPVMALISDFGEIPATPAQIQASLDEYLKILGTLGIRQFFEPVAERITLSTEAGVLKPSKAIFRKAIDKISNQLPFKHVMFITERKQHILAARNLGMEAVHFKGPGETSGDVTQLVDLIPRVRNFIK